MRAVLSEFVDRAADSLKTKVLSFADLSSVVGDTAKLHNALDRLARDEVVREKPISGNRSSRWQLDHDYIARAIEAEYRAANVLSLQLQDGHDSWNMAGNDIGQRCRSLLPLTVQAKLVWARILSRSGFTYGPHRLFASLSTLRALPFILLLVGTGWLWHEVTLREAADRIVDGLEADREKGGPAVIALWQASPPVRTRVVDRLLESPGRLRNAGTDWVAAFTSIETGTARDLMNRLISRLDRKDIDSLTQGSLFDALGRVGERLDAAGAAAAANDLISRLDRKDIDPYTQGVLIDTVASIAKIHGMHPTEAEISTMRVATGSIAWPLRSPSDSPAWARLETISGEKFDQDVQRLLVWLQSCCKLTPSAARPPFAD